MRRFRRLHRHVRHPAAVDSREAGSPEEGTQVGVEAIRVRRVEETQVGDGLLGAETHVRLGEGIPEGEIIIVLRRGRIRVVLRRGRIRVVLHSDRTRVARSRDGLRLGDRRSGDVRRNSVLRIASGETTGVICTTTTGGILAISTSRRDLGL